MRRIILMAAMLTITSALPVLAQDRALMLRVRPHRYYGMVEGPKSERIISSVEMAAPVGLTDASIDAGRMGRIRSSITVKNSDPARTIKLIEWRAVAYDEQRRSLHDSFYLSRDVEIKPGATRKTDTAIGASGNDKAVLPERALVIIQLSSITFSDGTKWTSPVECKPSEDMSRLECSAKAQDR